MSEVQIVRATGDPAANHARLAELLEAYVTWGAAQLGALGVDLGSTALADHHAAFETEVPSLLGPRGRLLIAELDGRPVGLVGLKPIDAEVAEVKRMYVRPELRGHGLGRRLLRELLAQAVALGYLRVRLETAVFMREAQQLYRSLGFVDTARYDGGESEVSEIGPQMRYLQWTSAAAGP